MRHDLVLQYDGPTRRCGLRIAERLARQSKTRTERHDGGNRVLQTGQRLFGLIDIVGPVAVSILCVCVGRATRLCITTFLPAHSLGTPRRAISPSLIYGPASTRFLYRAAGVDAPGGIWQTSSARPRVEARGVSRLSALIEIIFDDTKRPITANLDDSEKCRCVWTVVRRCRKPNWMVWKRRRWNRL